MADAAPGAVVSLLPTGPTFSTVFGSPKPRILATSPLDFTGVRNFPPCRPRAMLWVRVESSPFVDRYTRNVHSPLLSLTGYGRVLAVTVIKLAVTPDMAVTWHYRFGTDIHVDMATHLAAIPRRYGLTMQRRATYRRRCSTS